jgi:hypothetical protein
MSKLLVWPVEFAVFMTREFPTVRPSQLVELCALSKRHARYQEARCNRQLTTRDERAEERIEKRIAAVCQEIDPRCVPVFGGDPRGCTVKLSVPSRTVTDFGGEGLAVPQ